MNHVQLRPSIVLTEIGIEAAIGIYREWSRGTGDPVLLFTSLSDGTAAEELTKKSEIEAVSKLRIVMVDGMEPRSFMVLGPVGVVMSGVC